MSLKLAAISFFKENKFKYYIEKEVIYFSCPYCYQTSIMLPDTTFWTCKSCCKDGNLKDLIFAMKDTTVQKNVAIAVLYHPKKEYGDILKIFDDLIKKYDDNLFLTLKSKVENLFDYFWNKVQ